MKALLIDVQRNVVEYVDPRGLIDFYRLINCDLIDITCREINGKRYDIICDDYSLVRDEVKFSAVTSYGIPVLAGNLIITGEANTNGDQTDLQPQDIKHLLDNIHKVRTLKYPKGYWMLCNVSD